MDFEARWSAIHDPQFCERLIADATREDVRAAPPQQVFWMGDDSKPRYTSPEELSLAEMAARAGEHFAETFLRMARESKGKGWFTFRMFNQSIDALRDLLQSPHVFPILGDAGAHVSQIMDAGWASFVLSHWVREEGLFQPRRGDPENDLGARKNPGLKGPGRSERGHASGSERFGSGAGRRTPTRNGS